MTTSRTGAAVRSGSAAPRLSYLVFRLERRIRAQLDDALARHGVTTTEYMALSELRLRDRPSSAQLARIAFVSAQAMNLVIRDLERRGLVVRRPDPRGGRVLRVGLTRAGSTTLRPRARRDREGDARRAGRAGPQDARRPSGRMRPGPAFRAGCRPRFDLKGAAR